VQVYKPKGKWVAKQSELYKLGTQLIYDKSINYFGGAYFGMHLRVLTACVMRAVRLQPEKVQPMRSNIVFS